MKLYLKIALPDREIETRDFGDVTKLIIGRSEQCDFSLPLLNDLSRQHAELKVIDGRWHVSDLGSKFGTFVNDVQIEQPTLVAPSDVVRLGGHVKLNVFDESQFQQYQKNSRPKANGDKASQSRSSSIEAPPSSLVAKTPAGTSTQTPIAKQPISLAEDNTGARPWHIGLAILTTIVGVLLLFWYLQLL